MNNRIENLIKKGLKDKAAFDKELNALSKKAESNPALKAALKKEFDSSLTKRGDEIKELSIRMQLESVSELISLSYLARHYFGKSRGWLTQRVNGATVNGKKAAFTPEQINTLNAALQDVSKRIGSISVV